MQTPDLEEQFNRLRQIAAGIALVGEVSERLRARVMAQGELMATRLGIFADALLIIAGVLAIMVIKKIDERQEAKAKLIGTREPPSPPASFESNFRV